MDITLTAVELSMLNDLKAGNETIEDAFHHLFAPMLARHAEARLQRLADLYRALTPDLQLEALGVLKTWQDSKNAPKPDPEPSPEVLDPNA